jgi:hypothetical protein
MSGWRRQRPDLHVLAQLLSGCEMINCPSVHPMRRELKGYIDEGKTTDDLAILPISMREFSPRRQKGWFNSAWVMPFAVLVRWP